MIYAGPADAVEAMRVANAQAVTDAWQMAFIVVLGIIAVAACAYALRNALRVLRRVLTPGEMLAFVLVGAVCTWAAQKRLVTYPRTDQTQAYLTDAGSWVDSETDTVHIDFTRIIVPDSATMYVDRIERGVDGAEWQNHLMATFGEISIPLEFNYANATNFQWIVYTDWTPGPTVQTNGVWHANWGRDTRRRYIIPVRTQVRVQGDVVADPKSRKEAEDE